MRRVITAVILIATTTTTANAATRLDRVAEALGHGNVFVDPEVYYLLDGPQRVAVQKQITATHLPIYVVAVPMESGDESAGDPDYFAYLLHQRLGRPGIYLIADQRGGLESDNYQVPRDAELDYTPNDKPLPQKLHDAIDAYAHAPKAPPATPFTPAAPGQDPQQKKVSGADLAGQFIKAFLPAAFITGLLLTALWGLGVGIAQIVVRRDRIGPRRLNRMARAELVRLARAIGAAGEDNDGYPRAMEDYDAAKLLYDEKDDPGSRFAVVVLALDGQDALKHETPNPEARCAANPLHGPAEGKGQHRNCKACRRSAQPLLLRIDGRRLPYYEAPGLGKQLTRRDLPERVLEYLGVE